MLHYTNSTKSFSVQSWSVASINRTKNKSTGFAIDTNDRVIIPSSRTDLGLRIYIQNECLKLRTKIVRAYEAHPIIMGAKASANATIAINDPSPKIGMRVKDHSLCGVAFSFDDTMMPEGCGKPVGPHRQTVMVLSVKGSALGLRGDNSYRVVRTKKRSKTSNMAFVVFCQLNNNRIIDDSTVSHEKANPVGRFTGDGIENMLIEGSTMPVSCRQGNLEWASRKRPLNRAKRIDMANFIRRNPPSCDRLIGSGDNTPDGPSADTVPRCNLAIFVPGPVGAENSFSLIGSQDVSWLSLTGCPTYVVGSHCALSSVGGQDRCMVGPVQRSALLSRGLSGGYV